MEHKKNIFIIFAAALFFITLSASICNSVRAYRYRRLCDEYREQLVTTEEANRELADRFERITEITGRITKTTDANITDARGIIETVEILRTQIQELENICYGFNQSEYYEHWDSYYHDEGLMN